MYINKRNKNCSYVSGRLFYNLEWILEKEGIIEEIQRFWYSYKEKTSLDVLNLITEHHNYIRQLSQKNVGIYIEVEAAIQKNIRLLNDVDIYFADPGTPSQRGG